LNGRTVTSKGNRVVQNIFYTSEPIRFDDKENFSENNVFADPAARFNLAEWQRSGRDKKSVQSQLSLELDPAIPGLRWRTASPLPQFDAVQQINVDYCNMPRPGGTATPGPFENQITGSVVLDVCPPGINR
jgi:hypothetical protein